jgi:hypothetical protein
MGKQPTGIVIRFANDINNWQAGTPLDANTGVAVVIPTGADLLLQMFFSQGAASDATRIDYTNIATVYIALQSTNSPHNGTVYWNVAIANAGINNACTFANWTAGTDQQIQLAIPSAQNAFQATGGQQNYWLVIYGVTNDATPRQIVFCATQVQVKDSGLPIGVPTLPVTFKIGNKVTFVCADGKSRDVTFTQMGNGRWSLDVSQAGYNGAGQATYSLFCADGLFRDLQVLNVQGIWTLDVGQNGHN